MFATFDNAKFKGENIVGARHVVADFQQYEGKRGANGAGFITVKGVGDEYRTKIKVKVAGHGIGYTVCHDAAKNHEAYTVMRIVYEKKIDDILGISVLRAAGEKIPCYKLAMQDHYVRQIY
jgi:hypothetical protein